MSKSKVRGPIVFFLKRSKPYKGYSALLFVFRIVTATTSMVAPFILKEIIDAMVKANGIVTPEVVSYMGGLVLRWIFVYALDFFGWRMVDLSVITLESRVVRDLYLEAFDYLQRHSFKFFSNNFAGSLVRKVSKLARGYESFVDLLMFELLPVFLTTVIALVVIFSQNTSIGWVFLVWLIVHTGIQAALYKWKFKYDLAANEVDSKLSGHISDTITNQFTINSFGSYKKEYQNMKREMDHWTKIIRSAWRKHPIVNAVSGIGIMISQILIVKYMIDAWSVHAISIGTILLIQLYVFTLFNRLMFIGGSFKRFYQIVSEASEMLEIMETPHDIQNFSDQKLKIRDGRIAFENVDFGYTEENQVFSKLSFTIKSGERIAFVGESGAGKTSITKLLLRLYDIQGGTISIDGQDISKVTQESLRQSISYVPQDPILFHRSLKENIAYARPTATDEEIIAAAKMAKCHNFIMKLEEGYETLVGERGVKLSGGERQRVAIARAILANKPILIMDEATSALDSESEFLIQEAMEAVMDHKTVVVIAHRLSTIMKMDRIIVMDQGQIVEQGSHKELLLKDNGIYKKLRDIQSGGFVE